MSRKEIAGILMQKYNHRLRKIIQLVKHANNQRKTNTHVITQTEKQIHMLLHKLKNKYTCHYIN